MIVNQQKFYVDLVNLVRDADIDGDAVFATLTKVLSLFSLANGMDHEDFMQRVDYIFQFETYMQPNKEEIH